MSRLWKIITSSPALRVIILSLLLSGIGCFALWDYHRVDVDFRQLKALLQETRLRAISTDETLVVRFIGRQVAITDRETGEVTRELNIPTLAGVNYDTTLGDDMIVFDGHGTSAYNERVHGGDIRMKSWFGFRRNIAVNCTGLVTEGVYPDE